MIKIDIDFNLNVLLKLFFSLSKKLFFYYQYQLIIIKYLKFIVKILRQYFLLFSPLFFSSTHIPLHFYFFTSFLFCNLPLPPNSEHSSSPSSSFFFFFFLSSFLPLLKIYPYSFLFFFPSFLFFSFTLFCSLFFLERSTDSQSSPSVILPLFFLAHRL